MAHQHSPADSSNLDPADADRKLIAERVLKRVRLSKATRTLQTRLSLASFKASRGWHNVTFDVIEPHMMQAAQQRGRSPTAPVLRNGPPSRAPDRRRGPHDPAPTTFATPDRRPGLHSALQPAQRPSGIAPPTFSEFSHAIPHTDPARRSTYRHVSAQQPSLKRSSPHEVFQTSNQPPRTPSAPEPSSSNENVEAANVLSSLSRAPSTASLMSASPPAWPRSCPPAPQTIHPGHLPGASRTSPTPEGSPRPNRSQHPIKSLTELEEDEAQANAAELMLFLAAASPSPTRRAGTEPETSSNDPDPAAARRLFGGARDVRSPTLHSRGKQERAVNAVVLSASSSQASSRSAGSTVSMASTNSYCGQEINDLIQLTPDQRVRTAADARAKNRGLVRTQTQHAVGAEAKVW